MKKIRFVGLDVHAETIAVAVAEPDGEVRSLGTIPNREESVRKLVKKLGPPDQLRACYEAGPTGYVLYWQLTALGVQCDVVAPTLVPVKAGDRVKTDRRDALKLARSHRSGDLTAVWVPDEAHEALRDLVRAREAAKQDQLRARHRLSKFLLRHGKRFPEAGKAWTLKYMAWVRQVHFTQAAQEYTMLDYLHEVEHMNERVLRLEQAIEEAVKLAPVVDAGSGSSTAGAARSGEDFGGDPGQRVGRDLAFREPTATDGLQRRGSRRGFQRRAGAARSHHQDRQRPSATSSDRGGLVLSASSRHRSRAAPKAERRQRRGERDCLESAAPAAQEVSEAHGGRQRSEKNHYRRGARVVGLHLGHRTEDGSRCRQRRAMTA